MSEKKRINIHIDESLKNEWDKFAKEECHSTTSQMIRNAVREYRLKFAKLKQPETNPELELMKLKLEQSINERLVKMEKKVEESTAESKKIKNIQEIKDSILSLLEIKQPMKTKKISQLIRLELDKTVKVLGSLQLEDKIIKNTKNGWMIQ